MTEITGFLSGLVKAAAGRELATRWVLMLVLLAGMAAWAGTISDAWRFPSQAVNAAVGFVGFDISGTTTAVHTWFTSPIRGAVLTKAASWVAVGVLTVAFWVHSRQHEERGWSSSMRSAQTQADVGRFFRCATTFTVCLVVLAEIHGLPQPKSLLWVLAGAVGMQLLALVVTAATALFDRARGVGDDYRAKEMVSIACLGFLFMFGLTMLTIFYVPVRLYLILTTSPVRAKARVNGDSDG